MKHSASSRFWERYAALPEEIRTLADKSYELLRALAFHVGREPGRSRAAYRAADETARGLTQKTPTPELVRKIVREELAARH